MMFGGYKELLANGGKQGRSEEGEKGVGRGTNSRSPKSRILSRDAGNVATRLIYKPYEAATSTQTEQAGSTVRFPNCCKGVNARV